MWSLAIDFLCFQVESSHKNNGIYDSSWIRIKNEHSLVFIVAQDLFSKQKGYLEEELDYRKQALDQAYMVGKDQSLNFHVWINFIKYRVVFFFFSLYIAFFFKLIYFSAGLGSQILLKWRLRKWITVFRSVMILHCVFYFKICGHLVSTSGMGRTGLCVHKITTGKIHQKLF